MSQDITEQTIWSTKQILTIMFFAISITFYVTMIYNRFLIMEREIDTLSKRLETKDKRSVEDRASLWKVMQTKVDK